jgi:hypothetical protein
MNHFKAPLLIAFAVICTIVGIVSGFVPMPVVIGGVVAGAACAAGYAFLRAGDDMRKAPKRARKQAAEAFITASAKDQAPTAKFPPFINGNGNGSKG